MHLIRFAFISLFFLFLVITGISLFIPSTVRVSRTTNIFATRQEAANEIAELNNWKTWNPFFKGIDFNDSNFLTGKERKVNVKGTDISVKVIPDSVITATMTREGRKPVKNEWNILPPHNDSIAVNWTMDFDLRWYPWEKFGSLFFEGTYGPRMEYGLATLKKNLHQHHSSQ